jgi:DNA-binding transcriptional regulator YiaG
MTPDEIRAWREEAGVSQAQLAELLGVHAMTVSRWERAGGAPPYLRLALAGARNRAAAHCPRCEERVN